MKTLTGYKFNKEKSRFGTILLPILFTQNCVSIVIASAIASRYAALADIDTLAQAAPYYDVKAACLGQKTPDRAFATRSRRARPST
jgi:hypothetical protein